MPKRFRPGDLLLCVDAGGHATARKLLKEGELYEAAKLPLWAREGPLSMKIEGVRVRDANGLVARKKGVLHTWESSRFVKVGRL